MQPTRQLPADIAPAQAPPDPEFPVHVLDAVPLLALDNLIDMYHPFGGPADGTGMLWAQLWREEQLVPKCVPHAFVLFLQT